MKEHSRHSSLLGARRGGRRSRRRRPLSPNPTSTVISNNPPALLSSNLAAGNSLFSHIRVIPQQPRESNEEQSMQRSNLFTFRKPSFSEEAEAQLSSNTNPGDWPANLANASDGSSFAQKARAAELNAARARRAAQMQSVDDEIPDLSGPVSLGIYRFTRRGRGNRYETLRLSELQDREGENEVRKPAPTSSSHTPSNTPPPPPTFPSSKIPTIFAHQIHDGLDDTNPTHLNHPSTERRAFNQSGPPQYVERDLSHPVAGFLRSIPSPYSEQKNSEASIQTDRSYRSQNHQSNHEISPQGSTERLSLQTSTQAHLSFPSSSRQQGNSQQYGQSARSLTAVSGQASLLLPSQNIQRLDSEPYPKIESNTCGSPTVHAQSPQVSRSAHRLSTPKDFALPNALTFPDTTQTASFNFATNRWDSNLPEATMSAQNPTFPPSHADHSGGHSRMPSQMSHPRPDVRSPYAIVTTTKSGRPYTNPYMPIDPPPSTARPIVRESLPALAKSEPQSDDAELLERQSKTRYIDQEEVRSRALELTQYRRAEGPLDDPFQDQYTQNHQYGRNQPLNYTSPVARQPSSGQLPGYGHHPTLSSYTANSNMSPTNINWQQIATDPNAALSSYHNQRSAYEQQHIGNQRQLYGQANPRASVRLPAVRGTTEQSNQYPQEPNLGNLSLQGNNQPTSGRASHAVPIRDPAAYTGPRNQEAVRQNLDTVVASSQGPTASARTVMNDPHQDRRPAGEPSFTLRAQAPTYDVVARQWPVPTNVGPGITQRQEKSELVDNENRPDLAMRAGFAHDAMTFTKKAGLPALAASAGNVSMKLLQKGPPKRDSAQQRLDDAETWFRSDPRDLSYAAAVLPYRTMNKMNSEQFPIEDRTTEILGRLADDSQDDDLSDGARQAVTPRPIGHGRPAGFFTPPSTYGHQRGGLQSQQDSVEAMFGGVYCNLMAAKTGPYDYMNHYCAPPPYAIDHNASKNNTLFDPQWYTTAPPARLGRDRRREQGEYEDPTLGSANRRGDHVRGDFVGRDGVGRGGSGVRAWGSSDVVRSY